MGDVTYLNQQRGESECETFFRDHVSRGADHIVFATAIQADGAEESKVFSTLAKAKAWTDKVCGDAGSAIFVPYIIDVPEYGNIVMGERH